MTTLGRFFRQRTGASSVEFALILPGFIALTLGMLYLCMLIYANVALHFAVEDTARCMAVNVSGSCTSAQTYGQSHYLGPAITSQTYTRTTPSCGTQVDGSATFNLFTGLTNRSVTFTARSCFPT